MTIVSNVFCMVFSFDNTPSAGRSIHLPKFRVDGRKRSSASVFFSRRLLCKGVKHENDQKTSVISISIFTGNLEGKNQCFFNSFSELAIRPLREAEFTPLIFKKMFKNVTPMQTFVRRGASKTVLSRQICSGVLPGVL